MIKIALFLLPLALFADNLREILLSIQNNNLVISKEYATLSKQSEMESKKNSFFPTIDLGASYDNTNKVSAFQFKDRYTASAKLEMDLYDGGAKYSNFSKAKNELNATKYSKTSLSKSLKLQAITDFFECLSLDAEIKAKLDAKKAISEELVRVKKFVSAGLLPKDEEDRLRASYDAIEYGLEELDLAYKSTKKELELIVGKNIDSFGESHFKQTIQNELAALDDITSLDYTKSSIIDSARAMESIYYPSIKLRDTYSYYWYENSDSSNMPPSFSGLSDSFKIKEQNVLMLSANIRLFDFGAVKDAKNALLLSSKSLEEEIKYKTKEQKLKQDISILNIQSIQKRVLSAKSALVFATSAYESISKKYQASLVDYVTFLDALKSKTQATSIYKRALNDLEVAYANHYYFSGKNLEEFLSE